MNVLYNFIKGGFIMYVLPTERQILPNNTTITLNGTEYKILDTKGRGASCVVYLAENCTNKRIVLIKELYPINLGIFRDKENNLIVPNSFCEHFKFYKHKLCEAYKLQLEFHNSDETGNYTSDAETMVEAYSTLYVIMNKVVGSSYDKVVPENITDVLEVCKSVATAIGFYHKKGYLHLDIKPDNIYVLKETNQIINLFDFDTVKLKSDLENGNYIASTNKISAPEISKAEIDELTGKYLQEVDERADIYAIGHILFEKVMERDAKSSDIILGKKFNLGKTKLLKNSSPQLREKIQEIFQHTVVRMKSERYSNTDELIKALNQALEIATEEEEGYLIDDNITVTTSSSYYISRKDKLTEIRQHLENYHIAYLYGIGGIGKSETAREYAEEYRDSYTTIQLSIYSGDLKALIAGLKFSSDDKTGDYFEKDINIRYETKLSLLSKAMINNERTLLIIDNYNVEPDSDEYKRNVEVMKDLKKLHIHILFTTRTSPNDDKTKIDIEELSKEELRHMFFAINPKDKGKEERIAQVDELIETAYRHTLTVDLVAHQTAKIEGYGKKTLSDYIKVLKESGINSGINVAVYNNKDDNEKSDIIFEHIRALFNLTSLTEKERYIMVNACLLPLSGMPVAEFESFIDLENYPDSESNDGWGEDSTISNLVKGGWMKRINGEVSKITLHPIVSEVAVNELKPEISPYKNEKLCNSFIQFLNTNILNFSSLFSYKSFAINSAKILSGNNQEITADYLTSITSYLLYFGYDENILKFMKTALNIFESIMQNYDIFVAVWYFNIGWFLDNVGRYYDAIEYKLTALNTLDDGCIGHCYWLQDLERYEIKFDYKLESEKLFEKEKVKFSDSVTPYLFINKAVSEPYYFSNLRLRKKNMDLSLYDLSIMYSDIAYTYNQIGNYIKGDKFAKNAFELQNCLIKLFPNNCDLYFEMAEYITDQKLYDEDNLNLAIKYYLKVTELLDFSSNSNIFKIANSYASIGYVYYKLEDTMNKNKFYRKAIDVCKKIQYTNEKEMKKKYNMIATFYSNIGDMNKALYYKLEILEYFKKQKNNYPEISETFSKLALTYTALKEWDKALIYYQKSLNSMKLYLPINHPKIAKIYENIGDCFFLTGGYENATSNYQSTINIYQKLIPNNHLKLIKIYKKLSASYDKLNLLEEELNIDLIVLQLYGKEYDETYILDRHKFVNPYVDIAETYLKLKNFEQSLFYFLKSFELGKSIWKYNSCKKRLEYICKNISELYLILGDKDKAHSYKQYIT